MSEPKTKLGGSVIVVEANGKTRTLRRVYTDAVLKNGETPDHGRLEEAARGAIAKADAAGHNDGVVLDPWEDRRDAQGS